MATNPSPGEPRRDPGSIVHRVADTTRVIHSLPGARLRAVPVSCLRAGSTDEELSVSPRLDQVGRLSVWVYFADHRRPHIQVRGPGARANIDIRTGALLAGQMPPKELREIRRWLEPRRGALEAAFFAALRHEAAGTIVARYKEDTDGL